MGGMKQKWAEAYQCQSCSMVDDEDGSDKMDEDGNCDFCARFGPSCHRCGSTFDHGDWVASREQQRWRCENCELTQWCGGCTGIELCVDCHAYEYEGGDGDSEDESDSEYDYQYFDRALPGFRSYTYPIHRKCRCANGASLILLLNRPVSHTNPQPDLAIPTRHPQRLRQRECRG